MEWNGIHQMFDKLNQSEVPYVVLRNYEEITDENFYCSGHADIDFLVMDNKKFKQVISAKKRFIEDDGIHYLVNISGEDVVIDVRTVGDDYYDRRWEKDILRNRAFHDSGFFIPDDRNYYYSLIYHAILQKREISEEYVRRLNQMAAGLGISAQTVQEHLSELDAFMHTYRYAYTYPHDIWVPLNTQFLSKDRIKRSFYVRFRDQKIAAMQFASRIKHRLLKDR